MRATETKHQRFIRVVTPRVGKAVKAIKVIKYCTGSAYEYTPDQAEEISKALYAAMDSLVASLAGKALSQDNFSFED